MEEQDPDKDTRSLSHERPLTLPLGKQEMTELRDPWNYLTLYDEFLIMALWFHRDAKLLDLVRRAGVPDDAPSDFTVNLSNSVKAAYHLGMKAGLDEPRGLFWAVRELKNGKADADWGSRLLNEVILRDPVLLQIWHMRFADWLTMADASASDSEKGYLKIFGDSASEEMKETIHKFTQATRSLAQYDERKLAYSIRKCRPFWARGEVVPQAKITAWHEEYDNANKAELEALQEELNQDLEGVRLDFEIPKKEPRVTVIDAREIFNERGEIDNQKMTEILGSIGALRKHETETFLPPSSPTAVEPGSEIMATQPAETAVKKEEKKFTNVSVMFQKGGDEHIVLPEGMTYAQGREWLTTIEKEESRLFAFSYKFKDWYPFDAMWAVYRALTEVYGFAHVADFKTWFGPVPPSSITIDIDFQRKQQIPWGPIQVHGISAALTPDFEFNNGLPCLTLSANIKNNEREKVDRIMQKAEKVLEESSIYRGKAIEVDFTIFTPRDMKFDMARAPKFIDLRKVDESNLILSDKVHSLIATNIWTPIRHSQVCREQQIPLRRGVIVAGKYGVGKSLAALVTAKICQENNWTFLYLRDLKQLPQALNFAKKYQPCVVFAEDINRIVEGERDAEMDKIFNIIDGIDRKNDEVMTVFTTNNLEDIHPGMLRPGRIDSIIPVRPPDPKAAERLVRLYGREMLDPDTDLTAVGLQLDGQIPAIIREVVERSKLSAVMDTKPGERLVVRASHLEIAAFEMLEHAKLLEPAPAPKPDLVLLGEAMAGVLADAMRVKGLEGSDKELAPLAPTALMDTAGRPNNGKHNIPQTPTT